MARLEFLDSAPNLSNQVGRWFALDISCFLGNLVNVLALSEKDAKGTLWLLDELANSFFKFWCNNAVGGWGNQKVKITRKKN